MDGDAASRGALALISDIGALCNENASVTEIAQAVLTRTCACAGSCAGYAYLASEHRAQELRLVASHSRREGTRAPLGAFDRMHSEDGVVGRVHRCGEPLWVSAAESGGIAGAVLPILMGETCVGVFEFLFDDAPGVAPDLRMAMESIGVQFGRVVERRRLQSALARASNAEHRRIGRLLHDTVCQDLAGLAFSADHLHRQLRDSDHPASERARAFAEGARRALRNTRAALAGIVPEGLEHFGLCEALAQLGQSIETTFGVRTRVRCEARVEGQHIAMELFYIASEAVANAARHAKSDRIEIRVLERAEALLLEVEDFGVGIPEGAALRRRYGLSVMRNRALAIGARLSITSRAGVGTTVRCEVPIHAIDEHRGDPEAKGAAEGVAVGADR